MAIILIRKSSNVCCGVLNDALTVMCSTAELEVWSSAAVLMMVVEVVMMALAVVMVVFLLLV